MCSYRFCETSLLTHLYRRAGLLIAALAPSMVAASTLPTGFQEMAAFTGLTQPTAVRFSPDGRVFVAEKGASSRSSIVYRTRRRTPSPT